MPFRFPSDQQRLVILGATGSGKTNDALWHLSNRNFDEKPWLVYDFKHDDLIGSIEGTQTLELGAPLPQRPGVYVVHPYPGQESEVDEQMVDIWRQENIGVYVDEGYMVPKNSAGFRSILTQGRSKHIPMITLSQRPVWMDRFVFTEADFIQVFRLQHIDDTKSVEGFVPNPNSDPKKHPLRKRLPEYWSYYYDVGKNELMEMKPVPDPDAIIDTFDMRLRKIRTVI
jgi:hypothetical protein